VFALDPVSPQEQLVCMSQCEEGKIAAS